MDKDRIVGTAKDFAGKVEGVAGKVAGDAQTEASGRVREAAVADRTAGLRPALPFSARFHGRFTRVSHGPGRVGA